MNRDALPNASLLASTLAGCIAADVMRGDYEHPEQQELWVLHRSLVDWMEGFFAARRVNLDLPA